MPNPPPQKEDRFEHIYREFAGDREFEKRPPTRDQIARAWALAKFKKSNPTDWPTHIELVAALKKLFPEFKKRQDDSKPLSTEKK